MSTSRCALLDSSRKRFMNRGPETMNSSLFKPADWGGIGMRFTADMPDVTP